MSERAKKLMRPDLVTDEDGNPQGPPPEVAQMAEQFKQREAMLLQALQEAKRLLETKQLDHEAQFQLKELDHYFKLLELLITEDNVDRREVLTQQITLAKANLEARMAATNTDEERDASRQTAAEDFERQKELQAPPSATAAE